MKKNSGKLAHEHALNALSILLNESWSFELLGLVRYELGQAYYHLNKHLKKGSCACGDKTEDLEFYRELLIDVNSAISSYSMNPIPIVVEELRSFFANRKEAHRCIAFILNKYSMTHDI